MRHLCLFLLLLLLPTRGFCANTHSTPDPSAEQRAWFGDALAPYVVSGCMPSVAGSSLTLAAFACQGYVRDTSGELIYVDQPAHAVGPLSGGDGTYWLALHRDLSSAVSGWTRQAGSHYLWQVQATQPTDPAGALVVAQVTVRGGMITVVHSTGRTHPHLSGDTTRIVTDYGARGDGVTDDTAAIQAAWNALARRNVKTHLVFPPGTYHIAGQLVYPPSDIARGNIIWQGAGRYSSRLHFTQVSAQPAINWNNASASSEVYFRDLMLQKVSGGSTALIDFHGAGGGTGISFEDVTLGGAPLGIVATPLYNIFHFRHCYITRMTGEFFRQRDGGGSLTVTDSLINVNTGSSIINVRGSGANAPYGSVIFTNNIVESSPPLYLDTVSTLTFTGNHTESGRVIQMETTPRGISSNFVIQSNVFSITNTAHAPVIALVNVANGVLDHNRIFVSVANLQADMITIDATSVNITERGSSAQYTGAGSLAAGYHIVRNFGTLGANRHVAILPLRPASAGASGIAVTTPTYNVVQQHAWPHVGDFPEGARLYFIATLYVTAGRGDYRLLNAHSNAEIALLSTTSTTTVTLSRIMDRAMLPVALTGAPRDGTMLAEEARCSDGGTLTIVDAYIRVEY